MDKTFRQLFKKAESTLGVLQVSLLKYESYNGKSELWRRLYGMRLELGQITQNIYIKELLDEKAPPV